MNDGRLAHTATLLGLGPKGQLLDPGPAVDEAD